MHWNKLGKTLKTNLQGNFFLDNMTSGRREDFKKAFGLEASRASPRYERDAKGNPIKENPHYYQEDHIKSKQYVLDTLEFYAQRIGAQVSQVIQAVITNNSAALVSAISRNVANNMFVTHVKELTQDGEVSRRVAQCSLPFGYVYKGNPEKWVRADFLKAVNEQWLAVMGVLTDEEQAKEGRDAAVAKLKGKGKGSGRHMKKAA